MVDQFFPNQIRNFCIIAHINHGKSTLADRLLELTGTIAQGHRNQLLDSNPIEQERGITIKLAPVRMEYSFSGQDYLLNLIDTPGHVDFAYEVSRSLAACEGAILLVDAVSGIQAQTVANFGLAMEQGLEIIPVINKIDVPTADPERVIGQLQESFGFQSQEILLVSAKTGQGTASVLKSVVEKIPPPADHLDQSWRALVFNSSYDQHRGVLAWVRVTDGRLEPKRLGETYLRFLGTNTRCRLGEIGFFRPDKEPTRSLAAGEVGYLVTGLKDLSFLRPGDTVIVDGLPKAEPLPGYRPVKPMVYAGVYPVDNADYEILATSLEKLRLSDAALSITPEYSEGLGKGFRCGFLGLLHAEIVQERLSREFNVSLVVTPPTVAYRVTKTNDERITILTVSDYPDQAQIKLVEEPIARMSLFTPLDYMAKLIELCKQRRAKLILQDYYGQQVKLVFEIPLGEMVAGLYDQVKNYSSGFASLDWQEVGYQPVQAVRLDILFNGQRADSFSQIVPQSRVAQRGRELVERLGELIPRQQFEIRVQATVGGKILARQEIKAFRKDVTAKLYGGDRTRRMKLLEKQKKGKKKMRQIGRVQIPQDVFLKIFKSS